MHEIKMVIIVPILAGVLHVQLELISWDCWESKIEKQIYKI